MNTWTTEVTRGSKRKTALRDVRGNTVHGWGRKVSFMHFDSGPQSDVI